MPCYTVGLDLGQSQDYSALVVVERVQILPEGMSPERFDVVCRRAEFGGGDWMVPTLGGEWHVRHLQRWPLNTAYPVVVADVCRLLASETLRDDAMLFIDRSGVGRAVTDLFTGAYRAGKMGRHWPTPITITGGERRNGWNLPKSDLVDALQVPLQVGALRIAESLPLAPVLEKELLAFRQKIGAAGSTSYDNGRDDGHGDLVMALALALVIPNLSNRPDVITATPMFPGSSRTSPATTHPEETLL